MYLVGISLGKPSSYMKFVDFVALDDTSCANLVDFDPVALAVTT